MNVDEIQARLDAIIPAMLAKGLTKASAEYSIRSDQDTRLMLKFSKYDGVSSRDTWERDYHFCDTFDEADAFIAALPSAEETKRAAFMEQLAATIELGRANGIEVGYVNPLVETMRKLSENIITDQR